MESLHRWTRAVDIAYCGGSFCHCAQRSEPMRGEGTQPKNGRCTLTCAGYFGQRLLGIVDVLVTWFVR